MGHLLENTQVKIGAVVAAFIMVLGMTSSGIWWAATVNSKLDAMISLYHGLNSADAQHVSALNDLCRRVDKLELVGSPRATELEKRVSALEKGKP